MFVQCDICKYDSGDRDDDKLLAAKVNADGGRMAQTHDHEGKPQGWDIECPNGHSGDCIHLD